MPQQMLRALTNADLALARTAYLKQGCNPSDLTRIVQHNLDEESLIRVVPIEWDCMHKLHGMHCLFPACPRLLMLLHCSLKRLGQLTQK